MDQELHLVVFQLFQQSHQQEVAQVNQVYRLVVVELQEDLVVVVIKELHLELVFQVVVVIHLPLVLHKVNQVVLEQATQLQVIEEIQVVEVEPVVQVVVEVQLPRQGVEKPEVVV